jgi:hypothetical protein
VILKGNTIKKAVFGVGGEQIIKLSYKRQAPQISHSHSSNHVRQLVHAFGGPASSEDFEPEPVELFSSIARDLKSIHKNGFPNEYSYRTYNDKRVELKDFDELERLGEEFNACEPRKERETNE